MGKLSLLSIVVIFVILLSACAAPSTPPAPAETPTLTPSPTPKPMPTPPTPTPTPAPTVRLTAKEAYNIALDHATAKYGDVHFSKVEAGYANIIRGRLRNLAKGLSDEWRVSFKRQGGEDQWIGILVKVENGEVTYSAEGKPYSLYGKTWADYVRGSAVDLNRWNIDSPDGVEIAEEAGGAEFRLLLLYLRHYWEGPCWYMVFGPVTMEKGKHPGLGVKINAENGEVIRTETKTFEIY